MGECGKVHGQNGVLDAATREPFMPFVGQINLGLSLPLLSQKLTEE